MRTPARSVAWLLPLVLLTACLHRTPKPKNQRLAPPVSQGPPIASVSPQLPPSATTIPSVPEARVTPPAMPTEEAAKRHVRRAKPVNKNVEQAAAESPEVSAIGQLSPGDPSDVRRQTEASIEAIERGLKGINRALSEQEQKTAAQIREFLKQARTAMDAGDVDGAHTLALKAKVLLDEIKP